MLTYLSPFPKEVWTSGHKVAILALSSVHSLDHSIQNPALHEIPLIDGLHPLCTLRNSVTPSQATSGHQPAASFPEDVSSSWTRYHRQWTFVATKKSFWYITFILILLGFFFSYYLQSVFSFLLCDQKSSRTLNKLALLDPHALHLTQWFSAGSK